LQTSDGHELVAARSRPWKSGPSRTCAPTASSRRSPPTPSMTASERLIAQGNDPFRSGLLEFVGETRAAVSGDLGHGSRPAGQGPMQPALVRTGRCRRARARAARRLAGRWPRLWRGGGGVLAGPEWFGFVGDGDGADPNLAVDADPLCMHRWR
jgi:hypothetical protein